MSKAETKVITTLVTCVRCNRTLLTSDKRVLSMVCGYADRTQFAGRCGGHFRKVR